MAVKTIVLNRGVFENNNKEADALREYLKQKGVLLINVMSSPGAGKTTTLVSVIGKLSERFRIGVMEADIDSDIDAVRIAEKTSAKSIQLCTGGMCHIDASMTKQGLDELGIDDVDIVFLENVGNLVCPAEYDTGAHIDVVILSVPEGDDKPLKYPLVFGKSQLVIINKIDALPYFDFDIEKCHRNIAMRNKEATIIAVSAKTGFNTDAICNYIAEMRKNLLNKQ